MEKAMMKVVSSILFHRAGDLSLEASMSLVWGKTFATGESSLHGEKDENE
jgi:hypothetical protein